MILHWCSEAQLQSWDTQLQRVSIQRERIRERVRVQVTGCCILPAKWLRLNQMQICNNDTCCEWSSWCGCGDCGCRPVWAIIPSNKPRLRPRVPLALNTAWEDHTGNGANYSHHSMNKLRQTKTAEYQNGSTERVLFLFIFTQHTNINWARNVQLSLKSRNASFHML